VAGVIPLREVPGPRITSHALRDAESPLSFHRAGGRGGPPLHRSTYDIRRARGRGREI